LAKLYFKNVKSKVELELLGKKLYIKITEVVQKEIKDEMNRLGGNP
jgi:tmRNA-binding protein